MRDRALVLLVCAFALAALDQALKNWALGAMPLGSSVALWGPFSLEPAWNTGAAWSLGAASPSANYFLMCLKAAAAPALAWALCAQSRDPWAAWGCCFMLAGALGNLIDRVEAGAVFDFLKFSAGDMGAIFNGADVCVSLGALFWALAFLFPIKEGVQAKEAKAPELQRETGMVKDGVEEG